MPEQHNVEYKQSWHDEYLKEVCGFANARGGVLYIGKNDAGQVVVLADYIYAFDTLDKYYYQQLAVEHTSGAGTQNTVKAVPNEIL